MAEVASDDDGQEFIDDPPAMSTGKGPATSGSTPGIGPYGPGYLFGAYSSGTPGGKKVLPPHIQFLPLPGTAVPVVPVLGPTPTSSGTGTYMPGGYMATSSIIGPYFPEGITNGPGSGRSLEVAQPGTSDPDSQAPWVPFAVNATRDCLDANKNKTTANYYTSFYCPEKCSDLKLSNKTQSLKYDLLQCVLKTTERLLQPPPIGSDGQPIKIPIQNRQKKVGKQLRLAVCPMLGKQTPAWLLGFTGTKTEGSFDGRLRAAVFGCPVISALAYKFLSSKLRVCNRFCSCHKPTTAPETNPTIKKILECVKKKMISTKVKMPGTFDDVSYDEPDDYAKFPEKYISQHLCPVIQAPTPDWSTCNGHTQPTATSSAVANEAAAQDAPADDS